jgi:hypothetical protein
MTSAVIDTMQHESMLGCCLLDSPAVLPETFSKEVDGFPEISVLSS